MEGRYIPLSSFTNIETGEDMVLSSYNTISSRRAYGFHVYKVECDIHSMYGFHVNKFEREELR